MNLYPVERIELANGTLLLQSGEPIAAHTPNPIWEPLLRREIAERLALRVNFAPAGYGGYGAQTSFYWSSGVYRARIESWWRIAPVQSALSNPPLRTEGGRSGL
jgi:hypothetical protein